MELFFSKIAGLDQYLLKYLFYRTYVGTYVWISGHAVAGLGMKLIDSFSRQGESESQLNNNNG